MTALEVRPGQVWADDDPRHSGRTIRVDRIEFSFPKALGDFAVCTVLTVARNVSPSRAGTTTRIRLDRFRPGSRGYRLIDERTGQ